MIPVESSSRDTFPGAALCLFQAGAGFHPVVLELQPGGAVCSWEPAAAQPQGPQQCFLPCCCPLTGLGPSDRPHVPAQLGDKVLIQGRQGFPCGVLPPHAAAPASSLVQGLSPALF